MADKTTDTATKQNERNKIFADFYNNRLPERMPVTFTLPNHLMAQYGGIDPVEFQYDFTQLRDVAFELCEKVYSDSCPVSPAGLITRLPGFYSILGSNSFVMGKNGYVQHPETKGMSDDEYGELIEDPMKFMACTVIPRHYKNLDPAEPLKMLHAYEGAKNSLAESSLASASYCRELKEKFGYYCGAPLGSGSFTAAPYDFISDQLRGFSGISADIRRKRDEIKQACEVLLPLMFLLGMPANPNAEGSIGMPLHMPTFMREKDFAEIWLPSFKRLVEQFAARGARVSAFCEDDWSRYLDHLSELPCGTKLKFEYGEPKEIKAKLGDKMIISGLYPINTVKTAGKQQCLDKAAELLDTMLPGGGYIFDFDKVPLTLADVNFENYCGLAEYLRDNAAYDNAGAVYGKALNSECFAADASIEALPVSKLDFDTEGFMKENPSTPLSALNRFSSYDKTLYRFCLNLLI